MYNSICHNIWPIMQAYIHPHTYKYIHIQNWSITDIKNIYIQVYILYIHASIQVSDKKMTNFN